METETKMELGQDSVKALLEFAVEMFAAFEEVKAVTEEAKRTRLSYEKTLNAQNEGEYETIFAMYDNMVKCAEFALHQLDQLPVVSEELQKAADRLNTYLNT